VRFLHKSGARFDVKDKRGFTPLDTALGQAGGFGFGGTSGIVRAETAKAIQDLTGLKPSPPRAPGEVPLAGRGGRTQDEDQ
jgi:hypothetical protein